ncbi:MAG TPA: preprotein translocase subunit SecG [Gammaproteobacteria bacterium]|nr:preprotein translocase subunit SecG [Gammaproteobacteria bacterium]
MINILIAIHVLVAVSIVVLVLVQHGKGADAGAAFGGGGGASGSLFGSQGSANFLSRTTAVLATVFFLTSLSLTYLYSKSAKPTSVTDSVIQKVEKNLPEKTETMPSLPAGNINGSTKSSVPALPATDAGSSTVDIPVVNEVPNVTEVPEVPGKVKGTSTNP